MSCKSCKLTYDSIWGEPPRTMTAETDLERLLVDGAKLPLPQWRKNFFFKGGKNITLKTLTKGRFPAKVDPLGTHPVFAVKPIFNNIGFTVCPCSSSDWKKEKWIEKGTRLLHTDQLFEKNSYIIDYIRFNIPPSEALKLRFKGEVDQADIQSETKEM